MATALWTGSISFGLVSVPVKLFTAGRSHDVSFHQYSRETGARIRYRKVDEDTGDEVGRGDIVKGWDAGDGQLVFVDEKELSSLDPQKSEMLDILDFVALDEIDPVYYDKPYNIVPKGEAAAKAYRLLVEAMTSTDKVAIARFVLRSKEHLAAIRAHDGLLVLSTMRFADEVVDPRSLEGADLVDAAEVRDRERQMAEQLIENLTTSFDPTGYEDEHQDRVLELLRAKAAGQEVEQAPREERARVIDLTAALEASLGSAPAPAADATADGSDQPPAAAADYDELPKDELYELAADRKISGRSSMTKAELAAALRESDADAADAA